MTLVSIMVGYLRKTFEDHFQLESRLLARERFLMLSKMVIVKILESRKSDRLFDEIVNHLTNLFVADYGYITRWHPAQEKLFLIASTVPYENSTLNFELQTIEAKISEQVLQEGEVLLIEDIQKTPYVVSPAQLSKHSYHTRSAICLPLVTPEYKFGTVVLAYSTPRQFTSEDREYAEQVGPLIALALWTMKQEQTGQQQLNETRTMMQIGQALGETERIGLGVVLQLIVDSARELIPQAEKAVIHLVDQDDKSLVPKAASGFDRYEMPIPHVGMQIGDGAAGQVLRDSITINIADVNIDPRFLQADPKPAYHSLLVSPVQTAGKNLGTISVESEKVNAFSEHEVQLIKTLGHQAAIAIENTRLFETTTRSLEEMNALYHINQRLVASLDADILMKEVVDLLQQSFHYYHVQVYLISSEQRDSILRQGSGLIGAQLKEREHRLLPGEGIVGHVAYTSKPFVTNDVDKVVFFVRNPLLPLTKSELAAPIKLEGEVLGVLDIQQIPPQRLTERDLQIASAVAEQLAVALQKAALYTNLQTALHQEQTMRAHLIQSERLSLMGKLLASVSHELNNPLQTIHNALYLLKEQLQRSGNDLEELDIISDEMDRMATLLERLRSAYRPLHAYDFKPVQINDIIEDVYKLLSTHLRHKNISFEFHPDPVLPPVMGLADHLKQVTLNLFINAVEALPEGGHLCVDTYTLTANNEVAFSVRDNGAGIEPALLPRIFDPFVTNKETGTGLGLTITHEILQQHGGRISAENNPTGGAQFTVWLPTANGDSL
jgi:signal transduction histidine kinase